MVDGAAICEGSLEGWMCIATDMGEGFENDVKDFVVTERRFKGREEEFAYCVAFFPRLWGECGRHCPNTHGFEDIAQRLGCVEAPPAGRVKACKIASEEAFVVERFDKCGERGASVPSHLAQCTSRSGDNGGIAII